MDSQYKLGERVPIMTYRTTEPSFDRACEAAYEIALQIFGCDDCGHINNVKNADRSRHSIHIKFKGYSHHGGMGGQEMHYEFEGWVD